MGHPQRWLEGGPPAPHGFELFLVLRMPGPQTWVATITWSRHLAGEPKRLRLKEKCGNREPSAPGNLLSRLAEPHLILKLVPVVYDSR